MVKAVIKDYGKMIQKNPTYLLCTLVCFLITARMLGGKFSSYIITLIAYAVSITIALTPIGEKLLRLISRVRPIETNREKDYLLPIFEEVNGIAKEHDNKLNKVELCIIDNMTVNACALGRHTIAVTKGAMDTFSEDELKAVISHEFGHISNCDTVASLCSLIANGFFTLLVIVSKFVLNILDMARAIFTDNGIVKFFLALLRFIFELIVFLFSFLMEAAKSYGSRKNEYGADDYAFTLGYGQELLEALYLLEKISLGDNSPIIQKMLADHPRITARIKMLEAKL